MSVNSPPPHTHTHSSCVWTDCVTKRHQHESFTQLLVINKKDSWNYETNRGFLLYSNTTKELFVSVPHQQCTAVICPVEQRMWFSDVAHWTHSLLGFVSCSVSVETSNDTRQLSLSARLSLKRSRDSQPEIKVSVTSCRRRWSRGRIHL